MTTDPRASAIETDKAAQAAADAAAEALAKLSNMKPLEQRSNRGQNEEF